MIEQASDKRNIKKILIILAVPFGAYLYGWINNYTLFINNDFYNPISIFFGYLSQLMQRINLSIEGNIPNEIVAQIFRMISYSFEMLIMNIDLIIVVFLLASVLQKNINGHGFKKEYWKNKSIFNIFSILVIAGFCFIWLLDEFVIEYRFKAGLFGLLEAMSLFSLIMFYLAIGRARKKTEIINIKKPSSIY